jgi:hypothetical protein
MLAYGESEFANAADMDEYVATLRLSAPIWMSRCNVVMHGKVSATKMVSIWSLKSKVYPFNTGYSLLNYSGNPGVNGVSHRGVSKGDVMGWLQSDLASAAMAVRSTPFNTGYSPLIYGGNPGVYGVSYRGRSRIGSNGGEQYLPRSDHATQEILMFFHPHCKYDVSYREGCAGRNGVNPQDGQVRRVSDGEHGGPRDQGRPRAMVSCAFPVTMFYRHTPPCSYLTGRGVYQRETLGVGPPGRLPPS